MPEDPHSSGMDVGSTPAVGSIELERGHERGLVGLLMRVAVYFTLGMVAELLLSAWWNLIAGEDA